MADTFYTRLKHLSDEIAETISSRYKSLSEEITALRGTAGRSAVLSDFLPLSGGDIQGNLSVTTGNNRVFHLIGDTDTSYPNFTNIDIGWDYANNHGAGIGFRSVDHSTMPGCFAIYARDANDSCSLEGKPDGTLKWGGANIATQSYVTSNAVSKSGDSVSGKLTFSASDVISRSSDTSYARISGGQSADNGAVLVLYGPSVNNTNVGGFQIGARKVSTDSVRWLLGSADGTLKWGGQTVQTTSDSRLKTTLGSVSDDVLDAWGNVQWGQFKFLESVKDKGDSARLHLGVIAQQVGDAFEAKGLDACEYGILCHDAWEDEYEDGKLVREAGDLWMVRYTEALAMEALYQRRRMDRLEERLLRAERILNLNNEGNQP